MTKVYVDATIIYVTFDRDLLNDDHFCGTCVYIYIRNIYVKIMLWENVCYGKTS